LGLELAVPRPRHVIILYKSWVGRIPASETAPGSTDVIKSVINTFIGAYSCRLTCVTCDSTDNIYKYNITVCLLLPNSHALISKSRSQYKQNEMVYRSCTLPWHSQDLSHCAGSGFTDFRVGMSYLHRLPASCRRRPL
jgi:hypothetical protein